jgi:hypothetical protein
MKTLFLASFILCALFSPKSLAKNPFVASVYNEVRVGRFCGMTNDKDLRSAGYRCSILGEAEKLASGRAALFEALVFKETTTAQVEKNKCLIDRLAILKDPGQKQLFKNWYAQIALAWLGYKKSDLILEKCLVTSVLTDRVNYRKAHPEYYLNSRQPPTSVSKEWQSFCSNKKELDALWVARSLFTSTIPILSSPTFLDLMEKNRNEISIRKTGKPISDGEILGLDLSSDFSANVRVRLDKEMEHSLKHEIDNLTLERAGINKKLANPGLLGLSQEVKDFMFNDGTVYQTLKKDGLITDHFVSFNESARDPDAISEGAACLLAKYEPTIAGSLIDFFGTSLIIGEVGLAFESEKYLKDTSALKKAKDAFQTGAIVYGVPQLLIQAVSACTSSPSHWNTFNFAKESRLFDIAKAGDLPPDVGFTTALADDKLKEVKTCKGGADQGLTLSSFNHSLCLKNALLSLLPMHITLPASLVLSGISR